MKHVIGATVAAVLLAGSPAFSHDQESSGRLNPREDRNESDSRVSVAVQVKWGGRDSDVVRAHYENKHHRRLPPGLEKKYARTGQLPPGWQRDMRPLPVDLERKLPPLPEGYYRGIIEGRAVIYDAHSTIMDIVVVF